MLNTGQSKPSYDSTLVDSQHIFVGFSSAIRVRKCWALSEADPVFRVSVRAFITVSSLIAHKCTSQQDLTPACVLRVLWTPLEGYSVRYMNLQTHGEPVFYGARAQLLLIGNVLRRSYIRFLVTCSSRV